MKRKQDKNRDLRRIPNSIDAVSLLFVIAYYNLFPGLSPLVGIVYRFELPLFSCDKISFIRRIQKQIQIPHVGHAILYYLFINE